MEVTLADRVDITRLALQSDKERLASEKASFDLFLTSLSVATSDSFPQQSSISSLFKDLLDDAEFAPLTFDEFGNSSVAIFSLESGVKEEEELELVDNSLEEPNSSPLPPALLRSEDVDEPDTSGAPPSLDSAPSPSIPCGDEEEADDEEGEAEIEDDFDTSRAEVEDENRWPEWVQEEHMTISPELDMANVVEDNIEDEAGEIQDKHKGSWDSCQYLLANNVMVELPWFTQFFFCCLIFRCIA